MGTPLLDPHLRCADHAQFARALGPALDALPAGALPLGSGCTRGGMIDDSALTFSVLAVDEQAGRVAARVGVFFTEVVGGCNCSDDPVAFDAYCVLEVAFDRATGLAEISAAAD